MKIALLLEYDGTDFAGWQVQPNVRTVQGELETAFEKLYGRTYSVIGCGRTDAGVHARSLVAHTEIVSSDSLPIWKLREALNSLTGFDIVIKDVREVADDFHSRFSALERGYRYEIATTNTAIGRQYCWWVHTTLDIDLMQGLASALIGNHDFTSFSKLSNDVEHYRSIVTRSEFEVSNDKIYFWISANRFVRGMVRALIGAIVEAGKGRLSEANFLALLSDPTELDRARFLAPAKGLTFWNVSYSDDFKLW